MSENKCQHYVPRAYLDLFSNQEGKVYLLNEKLYKQIPHREQNRQDYFYTKDPQKENDITELEEGLLKNIASIASGKPLKTSAVLFLELIHLNMRNPKYDFQNEGERFDTVDHATMAYSHVLADKKKFVLTGDTNEGKDLASRIHSRWKHAVFKISDDSEFITSDNPSIFLYIKRSTVVDFIFCPIGPKTALFFYQKSKYTVVSEISVTRTEVEIFNGLTAKNAIANIYFLSSIPGYQVRNLISKLLDKSHSQPGHFKTESEVQQNISQKTVYDLGPTEITINPKTIQKFKFLRPN